MLARHAATAVQRTLIFAIKVYRLTLSPFLGRQCRYEPTCSVYAEQALRRFGVRRGAWLAVKRLGRCHPWGGSGYDPVPEPDEIRAVRG
jgi:putative membrane protein insertion efficiency factor